MPARLWVDILPAPAHKPIRLAPAIRPATSKAALLANGAIVKVGIGALILNGSDTYTGNTTVNGGSMIVGPSSFMASSPIITVSNNAILDVSAVSTTYFGNTVPQTLAGGGVVTGAVSVANSAINPGGSGVVGTLSFSNSLAMTGNVTNNFDIAGTGASDQIVVAGTLDIGSGSYFVINALNTAVPAGTYTLATFSGPLLSGGSPVVNEIADRRIMSRWPARLSARHAA